MFQAVVRVGDRDKCSSPQLRRKKRERRGLRGKASRSRTENAGHTATKSLSSEKVSYIDEERLPR